MLLLELHINYNKIVILLQRHSIGTTSVQYAHWFLKEMSDEVNQVITAICEEQCMLNYKVIILIICLLMYMPTTGLYMYV